MAKKIVIFTGVFGVGKSYRSAEFVSAHPEYTLLPCHNPEQLMTDAQQYEYVVSDYYFSLDWNAERLRASVGCPVEVRVLFDIPEAITRRQIESKAQDLPGSPVDCFSQHAFYVDGLPSLLDVRECVFVDNRDLAEYSYAEYRDLYHSFWKPYTSEQVGAFVQDITEDLGHDSNYQKFVLPHGFELGREGYSRNHLTWEIIKDWVNWPGKRVLELACFHGWFSQQLWFRGARPVGCDIHSQALYAAAVLAKINGTSFPLYHCDIDKSFPLGDYDIVFLLNALHHLKYPEDVLRRMAKQPISLFEVNEDQELNILEMFTVVRKEQSPKDNRILLLCVPKI